jgi:UDP-N-acetylmuramoyl-L-alanine---L-glutamate ligase
MRFSDLDGARVGVWGAGREIRSFALQLRRRLPSASIVVVASDAAGEVSLAADEASLAAYDGDKAPDEVGLAAGDAGMALDEVGGGEGFAEALVAPGARLVSGGDIFEALASCDLVVRSPGVSIYKPELRRLRARGLPVTTATALWFAERGGAHTIGVTGTKGKSTTATLIAHLARAAGRTVQLAGNIGIPALELLDLAPTELAVIELSSYQIADLEIGPEVVVFTNLHREHLDWHLSEDAYRADKLRILGLPGVRAAVLSARDPLLSSAPRGEGVEALFFGQPQGWDVTSEGLFHAGALVARSAELPLRGEHNALNLAAALTALDGAGVVLDPVGGALEGVTPLPHRLELVVERDGVLWVDDSISTTPESTLAALASFPDREIVLLAGGQDRGQDYSALGRRLAERGAFVVGLPGTGPRLVAAARSAGTPASRALEASGMEAAVTLARDLARAGSAVLLSPAAPSYNAYRSFEERGRHFRALLR